MRKMSSRGDSGWRIRDITFYQERRLATQLRAAMARKRRYLSRHMSRPARSSGLRLEDFFEFFLAWRVKFGCGNPSLWCDCVYELDIARTHMGYLTVTGIAYICDGRLPGSHLHPQKLRLSGVMRLASRGKGFSGYALTMRGARLRSGSGWRGRLNVRKTGPNLSSLHGGAKDAQPSLPPERRAALPLGSRRALRAGGR